MRAWVGEILQSIGNAYLAVLKAIYAEAVLVLFRSNVLWILVKLYVNCEFYQLDSSWGNFFWRTTIRIPDINTNSNWGITSLIAKTLNLFRFMARFINIFHGATSQFSEMFQSLWMRSSLFPPSALR